MKDSTVVLRSGFLADEMRRLSEKGRRKAEAARIAADEAAQEKVAAQIAEDKASAQQTINLFEIRAREAANAGKNWCDIMNLRDEDLHMPFHDNTRDDREVVRGRETETVRGRYTLGGLSRSTNVYGAAAFIARQYKSQGFNVEVVVDTNEDGTRTLSQTLRIEW